MQPAGPTPTALIAWAWGLAARPAGRAEEVKPSPRPRGPPVPAGTRGRCCRRT